MRLLGVSFPWRLQAYQAVHERTGGGQVEQADVFGGYRIMNFVRARIVASKLYPGKKSIRPLGMWQSGKDIRKLFDTFDIWQTVIIVAEDDWLELFPEIEKYD